MGLVVVPPPCAELPVAVAVGFTKLAVVAFLVAASVFCVGVSGLELVVVDAVLDLNALPDILLGGVI